MLNSGVEGRKARYRPKEVRPPQAPGRIPAQAETGNRDGMINNNIEQDKIKFRLGQVGG